MGRIKLSAIGAAAVLGALACPVAAGAAIVVLGGGLGEDCWRAAAAATLIHMDSAAEEATWKANAISTCDDALAGGVLDPQDRAATLVNRGILEMSREGYAVAERNFEAALKLLPNLAEAHVDLGSTLINMQRYEDGIRETQRGIDLKSRLPHLAYYNLGMAYERLGKLQEAYDSYKQAALLAPDWKDPKDEMARFVVQEIKR